MRTRQLAALTTLFAVAIGGYALMYLALAW